MVLPLLASIKKRRVILGLTQNNLASLCGLSQSVIAKIEQGTVDPSYTTAIKVFETLERLESKATDNDIHYQLLNLTAKDIMTRNIISVKSTDSIVQAAELLTDTKRNISQLPVIDQNSKPVGSVTEAQALTLQNSDKTLVKDIMQEPFPLVAENASLTTVRNILLGEPAVLVSDAKSNKIAGIITKFDLIRAIRGGAR